MGPILFVTKSPLTGEHLFISKTASPLSLNLISDAPNVLTIGRFYHPVFQRKNVFTWIFH